MTLPLLMLPWVVCDRRVRALIFVGGIGIVGLTVELWFFPHYAAPYSAVLYAIVLQAMRHLRTWRWRGKPAGLFLVRAIPVVCAMMLAVEATAIAAQIPQNPKTWVWYFPPHGNFARARLLSQLEKIEGRHLVIVRYQPTHRVLQEWVYNEADIDGAKVVWARDMGPGENEELLLYFQDRRAWLLDADENPPVLLPFISRPGP